MNVHRVGTYLISLDSWVGAEHCPVNGTGIGHLVVEESGVESKRVRKVSSLNIGRVGTYLTPLESWEGAEHPPVDRIGIECLAGVESRFEYWDRQELAMLPTGR